MIGGGGMANVYLARDMILDRDVAMKVLRMDFSNDEDFIRRAFVCVIDVAVKAIAIPKSVILTFPSWSINTL